MLYDHEYTIPLKSTKITLHAGDRFCLQKKLSPNWWRVTRLDASSPAEIVIPAQYAEEIRLPALPPKPLDPRGATGSKVVSDIPPKPPAKPGKKPSDYGSSQLLPPVLDQNVLAELYEILTQADENGTQKQRPQSAEAPVKIKASSGDKVVKANNSKSKLNKSSEDITKPFRSSSEALDVPSSDISKSVPLSVKQKSQTLGVRTGQGHGGGGIGVGSLPFGDFWTDDGSIFHDNSPDTDWKDRDRLGSVESLDNGFTEDDDSSRSSNDDLLKQDVSSQFNHI